MAARRPASSNLAILITADEQMQAVPVSDHIAANDIGANPIDTITVRPDVVFWFNTASQSPVNRMATLNLYAASGLSSGGTTAARHRSDHRSQRRRRPNWPVTTPIRAAASPASAQLVGTNHPSNANAALATSPPRPVARIVARPWRGREFLKFRHAAACTWARCEPRDHRGSLTRTVRRVTHRRRSRSLGPGSLGDSRIAVGMTRRPFWPGSLGALPTVDLALSAAGKAYERSSPRASISMVAEGPGRRCGRIRRTQSGADGAGGQERSHIRNLHECGSVPLPIRR